jgi:phosphoribosylformimino-5-aminoimidazole carboxamide ribotide isomerase
MDIIPVLDLKQGMVVHARMGRRNEYRPIETPLSPTSDPVDVARGLLRVHPFATLYVADLDAIARNGDNHAALTRLRASFPQVTLWVDNGICDCYSAWDWLEAGWGHLVLGSETQRDPKVVRHLARDARVALSLDFRGPSFQGPRALLDDAACWPQKVIAMTLARVGSGAGPDLERLCAIRAGTTSLRGRWCERCHRSRYLEARRHRGRARGFKPSPGALDRQGDRRAAIVSTPPTRINAWGDGTTRSR